MIFLDSANINEIRKFNRLGIIRGVTTNPSIMKKDGISDIFGTLEQIVEEMTPYPVFAEITTNDSPIVMIHEAVNLREYLGNTVGIKIPIHGPNGELFNLEVIRELEKYKGVIVNATACMSAQQCLLAAMSGASYVSLFGGRINNTGINCIDEIKKIRKLFDRFDINSKLILGSTREVLNITEWLEKGADFVTVTPDLLEKAIINPSTKEVVSQFLSDAWS